MKGIWKNVMMGVVCLLVALSGITPVGAKEVNSKHDAVVVGAGGAGLTAALTLALGGADVIVFEKMKFAGGSTNFAEGIFAVESPLQRRRNIMISKEEAFKEHMEFSHWRANPRLVRAVIDKSGETIDWLMGQGVEFVDPMSLYPGGPRTWHVVKGERHCAEIIKALVARLNERGIKISYETPVKGLIKTKEGRVTGVMAEDKEGNRIKAEAKAVIIATGGFANSKEMLSRYTKADPALELLGNMGKTGDGIRMAFEAGAAEKGIDVVQLTGPYVKGERGISTLYACLSQPFLWINKLGERFMNEGTFKFPYVGNALAEQPDQIMYSIFDENSKIFVKQKGIDFGMGVYVPTGTRLENIDEDIKRGMDNGQVFVADSIRELAEKIHVAPEALEATVNEYNRLCDKGQDDLFGKPSKYLYPVRAAGFYAIRGYASATGTIGGVKINHKTEALDKDFRVIPGLYVAGNDAGGFYGDSYEATSSGGTMGFAINTGRIAGENALDFIGR
jgi:fumarate reductase flavoprotein subunit